jgi:uncharacterized membrane protein
MEINDIFSVLKWFSAIFFAGLVFLPFTFTVFKIFKDKGYIFSKIISLITLSYTLFVLGSLKLISFSTFNIALVIIIFFMLNLYIAKRIHFKQIFRQNFKIFVIEELIFFSTLFFWSYIRGNAPDIHGLEKFMDFGMLNSILRNNYFPPTDMWYSGSPINYYYFGHLITAIIIKMSSIPSGIGYNLMLATLFAFTFTSVISLSINLFNNIKLSAKSLISSMLSASFVALGGNLTTIYTFFKPYVNEHPVPFWNLVFAPLSFPNSYWYPNATRFIPYTIHELPLYSFIVSDLHGHVLDIPIVLLTIALLFSLFLQEKIKTYSLMLISVLLAIMYMTNAWDGLIYMLLSIIVFFALSFYKVNNKWLVNKKTLSQFAYSISVLILGFFIFSFPFSFRFKPFVSGLGIICAPKFLTDVAKIGPFLFEPNHCQRSPLWQLVILYGFFYFFVISFILFLRFKRNYKITKGDQFISFLIILSTLLIIIPEFIYIKDIYPMHYRANTMFKLTYEAFMMLSISCGYIIIKIFSNLKNKITLIMFFIPSIILIYMVLAYPVFAINSYYDNLKNYKKLDGTLYMQATHSQDYDLINWINKNIKDTPIILESAGDSYTDYARISAYTGLPTVVGWPVHEWLWRGTYDVVGPRVNDVKTLYTSSDLEKITNLINKYNISYVVVADLDRQKYTDLNEANFKKLGKIIYSKNGAKIYRIN